MSVGKIALGVFLGNLATAILSCIVLAFVMESQRADAVNERVNASYNAMLERQAAERSGSTQP